MPIIAYSRTIFPSNEWSIPNSKFVSS